MFSAKLRDGDRLNAGAARAKRFENGYLLVAEVRKVPVRVHWTAPVAALIFGRFQFVPAFWIAFLSLILIHEIGHALIVRRCKKRVTLIELDGTGGKCHWRGELSPRQHVAIAWGGVLAQAVVLVLAGLFVLIFGHATSKYGGQIEAVAIRTNLFMAALNLLPIPPWTGRSLGRWCLLSSTKQGGD
ncbi:MAG: hypothetical protein Q8O67_20970 [Deltaproteobacteria bacterium]|nr:hypothetical protein [Deltaproteobacteria bacterium]